MLTQRGWWLLLVTLALTLLSLVAESASLTLIALTLLCWFLGQWLEFVVRWRRAQGKLSVHRELRDERGPVNGIWARRPVNVRVALHCEAPVSFPFISMIDKVPALADERAGDCFAEGPLDKTRPLEATYRITCPAAGRLRFEGLKIRCADLHGFFARHTFIRAVRIHRVLPALADAEGHIPSVKRHNLIPLMGHHPHRRPGSGSELLDLRDYLPGDPPKMIAWKASARRDRLMTKEFESEVPVRCTLFVDTSSSVRLGTPGKNALARIIEIAAAVIQANAAARDLTGICLFDEERVRRLVRPGRGSAHQVALMNVLADAADLGAGGATAPLARLLPLACGAMQDLYPDCLEGDVNAWPFWLPILSPRPWYTTGPLWKARRWWLWPIARLAGLLTILRPWKLFGNLWRGAASRHYRWRKQAAAVLSVHYGLGPGGLALLLEDDDLCARYVLRFLEEHQIACPMPLYDEQGRYLFGASGKVDFLASALTHALALGRDNELFVLVVDFLEVGPRLETVLRAVRVALGRHHQVIVVCPWQRGVQMPGKRTDVSNRQAAPPTLQELLSKASTLRLHQAFAQVRQSFARLGVPVVCAPAEEVVGLVLERMQRLRSWVRGAR